VLQLTSGQVTEPTNFDSQGSASSVIPFPYLPKSLLTWAEWQLPGPFKPGVVTCWPRFRGGGSLPS
jgi:hypothetical protein